MSAPARENPMHAALARGDAVQVRTGLGVSFIVPAGGYRAANGNRRGGPSLRSGGALFEIGGTPPGPPVPPEVKR